MLAVLLNMLMILGIIAVGFAILAVVLLGVYAVLYIIYRAFIDTDNKGGGRKQ